MSIAYRKIIMGMTTTKFLEFKLSKSCNIVNRLKSDSSLEEMKKILEFYTKKTNKNNNI